MKFKILHKFIVVVALIFSSSSFSQQAYQEEFIRFYQGLPSDIVEKTQTDSRGFLYVSTQRGLSLYDGYRFVSNTDIKPGVSGLLYSKGTIYFHDSKHGLSSISNIHDVPKSIVKNNYEDIYPNNDHFDNIFVDSESRVWSSDFNNLKYKTAAGKVKSFIYDSKNNSSGNAITFIEPSKGQVWAFTPNGLFVYTEKTNILKRHSNTELGNLNYSAAFMPDSNRIYFALNDGRIAVLEMLTQKISFISKLPSAESAKGFGMLANRNLVIYTKQKIYTLPYQNSDFTTIFTASGSQINHVLTDRRTHLIWVSTNKGLVKLTPVEAIKSYRIPNKTIDNNKVIAIEQDSKNRIFTLDSKGECWSIDNLQNWKRLSSGKKQIAFTNLTLCHSVMLLTSDQNIFRLNNDVAELLSLDGLPKGKIRKAIVTGNENLWILVNGFPPQRYSWPGLIKYNMPFGNADRFWTENTWNDILENKDGTVWIAGWSPKSYGMIYYNRFKNIFIDNSDGGQNADRRKFFGDYVNRIALAKNNELLFSGYGGFNFVKANGDIKSLIDINNYPIANGRIEGIALDNNDNVVFATGDGLHVYHPESDKVIRISQADGLPTDDLIYGFKKLSDGKFALGTDNGFTIIDVDRILEPNTLNRLQLTEVKIDGIARSGITSEIELNKDQNDATLYFSNLSFSDKQKVFYRYRFSDEKKWNLLGNNPELTLNHIVPGNYNLIIEAGNNMSHWQSRQLRLKIIAHPPFYQSVWFYILVSFVIISVVILVNRYLLNRQRQEAKYKEQIKESEMQTLRAQMNPHFMFNTLNSINSFIIQNKTEAASSYLTTFSKLMRSILEYSKSEFIPLEKELQALKLYLELEAVRLENSFDYTIEVPKDIRKNDMIKVPPLILQPFVENAIWHGLNHKPTQGNLYIKVSKNDDFLQILIEDDGTGREAARKLKKQQTSHKSYGIEITQQRIQMLHTENSVEISDLEDNDRNAIGTAVTIILKL